MLREVRLYGQLGAKFGRMHRFDVATPAEAVRALVANFPALEKYLISSEKAGIRFAVFVGKTNIGEKELEQPAGKDSIRIAPMLAGSAKAGALQTVLGLVLIAASFIPGNPFASQTASIGIAMALGGIAQLLAPVRQTQKDDKSYVFNGAVNTTAQGAAVPVGYGRMIVGSVIISAGITTEVAV